VVDRVMPRRRSRVLEIGCGRGAFGSRLARRHYYTGVEPDPVAFAAARDRVLRVAPDARVVHGFADALGPGATFDVVCAFEVLEHIDDDAGALREWFALVRPGGRLVLSTPAWPDRYGPWDEAVGHFRRYEPTQLADRLRDAGFVDPGVRLYGAPLGYLLELARDRLARPGGPVSEEPTMADRTARSGRVLQPSSAVTGAATAVGTWPFRVLQRAFPTRGTGLVAWATRPR
jgi:SAM-dependent methyltransferase